MQIATNTEPEQTQNIYNNTSLDCLIYFIENEHTKSGKVI